MLQRVLNLGVLAHVDAGKTTLTERLLQLAGVIDEVGSVDAGTTQTDTLALERQRGITIKSAVVSFTVGDTVVNLIDTPGHPDFIAEVERVLDVLDGAILVISAVEGVQPQTRILMRALQRLRVPTVLFVNKVDRRGADLERVLARITARLTPAVVPLTSAASAGTPQATVEPLSYHDDRFVGRLVDVLSRYDEPLLADYLERDGRLPSRRLRRALGEQTRTMRLHPVFAGSALTGAGVADLLHGTTRLLARRAPSSYQSRELAGRVFTIAREPSGDRVAYVRIFDGALHVRDRVAVGGQTTARATAIAVFDQGRAATRGVVEAGRIAKVWGLDDVKVGDGIGALSTAGARHVFAPPPLESVVEPVEPADGQRLRKALAQLADQDPLISVRSDASGREVAVSLYGEVQQEIVAATLSQDYGLQVRFREATPIYVERPTRPAESFEVLHAPSNPYNASIGLRVEPASAGSGVRFSVDVDWQSVPLYVYKTADNFATHMEDYMRAALRRGPHGWEVTDCVVTMNRCMYSVPDGPPSRSGPLSTAADFRKLTPLVMAQALADAGMVVCEPTERARLEIPAETVGVVLSALARLGAAVEASTLTGELAAVEAVLPAARMARLRRQLSGLTAGEGVLESELAGYRPLDA